MNQFPPYNLTDGIPLYWLNEGTGVLRAAVKAFLDGHMETQQLELLRGYFVYHINAPCWRGPTVAELRKRADTILTIEDLHAYYDAALDGGLDPL